MSTHSINRLIALGTLGAALMLPARLVAQASAPATYAPMTTEAVAPIAAPTATATPVAATNGPRLEQAGISRTSASAGPNVPPQFRDDRRDVAWMVVGGAALVVGSMVGGDAGTIIMITGGVIGLMGLFRYMQ